MFRAENLKMAEAWVSLAKPGERCIYWQGDLVCDRQTRAYGAVARRVGDYWRMLSDMDNIRLAADSAPKRVPGLGLVRLFKVRNGSSWKYIAERTAKPADDLQKLLETLQK